MNVRFVIYKNSVLASAFSMFGASCVAMGIGGLIGKEINFLETICVVAAGLGLMWLGSVISERKEKKKQTKAEKVKPVKSAQMICPHCRQENTADSKYCVHCGHSMSVLPQGFCIHCHHQNAADGQFCAQCGRPITKPAKGFCLQCYHQNASDSRFCERCGKPISG